MQGEMSNYELHKLRERVWPWPWTFKQAAWIWQTTNSQTMDRPCYI